MALTFDDGPNPTYTPQLLGLLKQHNIKATFCLVGIEAEAYPNLVADIIRDGHTLCNHSWRHDTGLGSQSHDAILANLTRTNQAIRNAAPGAEIKYYRQPGGYWTGNVVSAARSLGMQPLHWQIDTQDWRQPGPEAISASVMNQTQPGSIILMHDSGGNRADTVAACRTLFPQLKDHFPLIPMP